MVGGLIPVLVHMDVKTCQNGCVSLSVYTNVRKFQSIFCVLESLPVPTITILNGTTLGAGMELALSCDFRVADSAFCKQIGLPEVKIGVLPGSSNISSNALPVTMLLLYCCYVTN